MIVQLRIGGQTARLSDETIPGRFGFIGQETTGAGGFAKALRTVPVVLELAEETARRGAAGAWFVDFTNPTGLVTQALLDDGHRAVGLCNVAISLQRRLAERFGVEPDSVTLDHVGLNHLTWERAVIVDGHGPDGRDRARTPAPTRARTSSRPSSSARSARSRARTCATTTSPPMSWSTSARIGAGPRR